MNAQELRSGENSKYVLNYVQISNNLGLNGGWTLTVKQEGQFANATVQHKELIGRKSNLLIQLSQIQQKE